MSRLIRHQTLNIVLQLSLWIYQMVKNVHTFMVRPPADLFLTPAELPVFVKGTGYITCSVALSAGTLPQHHFQAMNNVRKRQVDGSILTHPA